MFKYFRRKIEHEYIRIHVTIADRPSDPSIKFCIDPQVSDLHAIRQIIHLAFDVNRALIINWITYDDKGLQTLKTLNTDNDFQEALRAASTHELHLRVEYDQTAEQYNVMEYHKLVPDQGLMQYGRDTISGDQVNLLEQARSVSYMYLNLENSVAGAGYSISSTSSEISLTEGAKSLLDNFSTLWSAPKVADLYAISSEPLTKLQFDQMFDANGRMTYSYSAFKLAVYQGGVELSIRPAVWRFLLNLVDYRSTGEEHRAQMESYAKRYTAIRDSIIIHLGDKVIPENLRKMARMVHCDVIRTDNEVPYFGGDSDTNEHLMPLFYILLTYSMTHPAVGYCQGMNDFAAALLYVFDNEVEAYVGFCALMRRCGPYFIAPVNLMRVKYRHFSTLVERYEPEFWAFSHGVSMEYVPACYRWLVLEMKREFRFDEAIDLMPIMWAGIPTIDSDIPPFKPVILCDIDPTKTDDIFVLPWDYLSTRPSPPPPMPPPQPQPGTSQAVQLSNQGEGVNKRLENLTRSKRKTGVKRLERERKAISLVLDRGQRPESQSVAFSCPVNVLSQALQRYFTEGHSRRDWPHYRNTDDDNSSCWTDLDAAIDLNRRKDGSSLPNKSTSSKSKRQEKLSRTTSCCHLDAAFGTRVGVQSHPLHKKSSQWKCKSAMSLLESDADENDRGKLAKKITHAWPKVSQKRLYFPVKSYPASRTNNGHLSSSRNGTQESNKRIRSSATSETTSRVPAVISNGDQLNHFHGHCFDVVDHGTNSDSDDSGIGTTSSTIKDSSGCGTQNVSLSGSIVSERSANFELLANMKNSLSNAENLAFSTMLIAGDFSRRFYYYWSMLQQFADLTVDKDKREVFIGYKYANLFKRLMGTCLHSLKMNSFLPLMMAASESTFPCSTKLSCDCESCRNRIEKFYFTERVQFSVTQKRSVENCDDVDDKMINDIEDSYDSFIIIQPIEEHISCQKNAANLETNIDKERSCSTVSKANRQQINSETRMRRFNRFFASLFRRSNSKEQRRRSISSTDNASPSRETPVKDDDDLRDGLDDNAADNAKSATSSPVPMAMDATEDFFDDFKRGLTLSRIKDLCSRQPPSTAPATRSSTAGPSTSKNNHRDSKSKTSKGQNSVDNQVPSTSAQAQAEQSNIHQASVDVSEFVVIPTADHLPPIEYIGGGNPFMIFVGLAIIHIYKRRFSDRGELRVLFDKFIFGYEYAKVIRKARRMYARYLKSAGY